MTRDAACIFCKIVERQIPATIVHESDHVLAFRDMSPQAPTHVLIVPKDHYRDVPMLAASAPDTLADVVGIADTVAANEGITAFRLVFNTGAEAGQSVFHVHAHLLGGRAMTWPPG